jgi:hypothetical protein
LVLPSEELTLAKDTKEIRSDLAILASLREHDVFPCFSAAQRQAELAMQFFLLSA